MKNNYHVANNKTKPFCYYLTNKEKLQKKLQDYYRKFQTMCQQQKWKYVRRVQTIEKRLYKNYYHNKTLFHYLIKVAEKLKIVPFLGKFAK